MEPLEAGGLEVVCGPVPELLVQWKNFKLSESLLKGERSRFSEMIKGRNHLKKRFFQVVKICLPLSHIMLQFWTHPKVQKILSHHATSGSSCSSLRPRRAKFFYKNLNDSFLRLSWKYEEEIETPSQLFKQRWKWFGWKSFVSHNSLSTLKLVHSSPSSRTNFSTGQGEHSVDLYDYLHPSN